jgi:hypothetical protein
MSIDQLGMILRCLIVLIIAGYLALGYFVVSDLLQGSTISAAGNAASERQ